MENGSKVSDYLTSESVFGELDEHGKRGCTCTMRRTLTPVLVMDHTERQI